MIKSKLLKVITLATGLMAAGASFGANGDIFEIRPCDQDGQSVSYNVDINNPMTSGESLYFKVRLIRRSKTDNNSTWTIKPNFGNMPSGDYEEFPEEFKLGLGIYVSGQERYAVLDSWKSGTVDSTGLFTDLIFKYKTRAGDVALPIVLATENGPASDNIVEDAAYKLRNENIWEITNGNGNSCNFWFWSMTLMPESDWGIWGGVSSPDGGDPVQDYSLAKCNFYVQTINFDETWEEEGKIWRSVHANSTITAAGLSPKLVAKAPPEDKVELYVWSTDENVVRVKSNETVELKTDASGTTKTTQIGKVVFSGGQITPVDFQIEGVAGGSGQTCKLVLSPWKNYNYSNATSTRLTDYIEVPVKCLDPLPPTVTVETDRAVAYADGNYMVYGAVMSVYLSEAYDKDMTVKITPTIDGVAAEDIGKYIRFSETQTEVTALPEYEIPVVTIPAGPTAKKQVYIFCLRGDAFTTGTSRIVFTPSVDDAEAAAFLKNYMTAGMQVVAEKPVIATPAEGSTFIGVCGEDTPFTLVVEDTYADSSDIEEGYKILVKYRMTELWKELKGRYYVGEGGALFLIDENASGMDRKSTQFPVLNYPVSGEGIESQVKIVSPVSGKESEVRNFIANIKAPRSSEIIEVNDKMEFFEGEQATLQIKLSEPNDTGNTIYAYLRASEDVTAGMLSGTPLFVICDDTDLTKTRGLPINPNQSATSEAKIKFLDGISDGLSVQFQVVLSTSKTFDGKQLSGYQSNYLNLMVYNLEPTIKRIEMNGNESEGSGYTYPNKIPKGMERTFVAVIDDKGTYDKTTTVDGEEFRCKWTLKREGQTYGDPIETKGDPAKNPLKFNFPQAGKWSVKLQVRDKDMDDWAEASYEVYLNVLDNPLVEISVDDVYVENETKGRVFVGLSYWDDQFEGTLRVKLTVDEWVKDKVNYGCLKLDDKFKSTNPADGDNVYYVDLNSAAPVPVAITELDGTDDSSLYGFVVKAEVVSNNLLPTSNQSANSYYLAGEKQVLVYNADPVCEMSPGAPTNRWEVSGGVDMMHKLTWRVKSDVLNDLTTGLWKDGVNKGIKVSIMGPLNATEFYVDKATSGEFHPDFGDLQGDIDVTFLFEDKDGGSQIFTYQYTVKPSKFLVTGAHGPGGGLATSALSRKYASLDGIGAGHTFAEGVTFSSASNFRLTWNCGSRQDVNIYGFGYKVANPVDDGSLDNGQDIALTPEGFNQTDINGPFYTYPPADAGVIYNDVKDSFFYCWLLHSVEEGSCVSTVFGETFSPEQPGVVATGTAYLPVDKHEDGSFAKTEVEAIFAREYFREDNVGDINYDSIPDLFAHKTWQGGNMIELASGGTIVENNLIAINGFNLDGDRLPKVYEGGQNNFNYAPIGPAFNARLEIRGFHPGLNAIDIAKSDASFCEFNDDGTVKRDNQGNLVNANELIAWREFMRARSEAEGTEFDENMMPTAADLLIWSPEPRGSEIKRMDPTVEDTDGDGFPDGWEYYLWYRAHVTARVPRSNVRFERFNYANILQGTAISPDEVEARFNPCEPLTSEAYGNNPDFDKDGLSDLEELAIGTNPCHWDTDGDRMCDGWEVMMSLNPLAPSDKRSNLDGDFMAYYELSALLGVDNGDGTVTFYPELVRGLDYTYEVEIIEGVEVPKLDTLVFVRGVKQTQAIIVRGLVDTKVTVDDAGEEIPEETPRYYGLDGEDGVWGCQLCVVEELTKADFSAGDSLEGASFGHPLVLLHDQVRYVFGFDPRTAWSNIDGYVATRWDPNKNNALGGGDMTGAAVNTREYTAYDEYLVMKYRHDVLNEAGFNDNDPWATLMSKTTNPSVVEPEIIDPDGNVAGGTGNSATNDVANAATNATINAGAGNNNTTAQGVVAELLDRAFAEAGSNKTTRKDHGADTDGDGVPDGWELYMKRNPNMLPGENEDFLGEKDMRDYDDDELNYVSEYAGTDSCNAYRDCPSIYAHHPGLAKGWYNKFFPTNPGEPEDMALAVAAADTDGDGITDAQEGASFPLDFYNAGVLFRELELNFIYGSPEDDGMITCIRGGGMNPCSVDTDLDAIPDGWEMQHAGVPVNARTKSVVPPSGLVGSDAAGKFADISAHFKNNTGTFLADGIHNAVASTNSTSNITASAIYIAGGMDATWAGDTGSDLAEKGTSWDELLGGARDVDFDHDGLQNYQEYYIQAVRHFRYDDISTPLMGRLLTENATVVDIPNDLGISVPTMIDANHTQKFMGYVPFDPSDPSYFVTMASIAWQRSQGYEKIISDCVNYEKEDGSPLIREPWTVEGWRNLGYFAPPPKSWDRATVSGVLNFPLYMFPVTKEMTYRSAVAGYVTSDPRMADTDADGMDDFYEMFHGLNPILGTNWVEPDDTEWAYFGKKGDIISATYNQAIPEELFLLGYSSLATFNAYYNEWIYSSFMGSVGRNGRNDTSPWPTVFRSIQAPMALDPVMYPWLQGTAEVDSDGDGISNDSERPLANVADPMPIHTDPTPLWFTERTTPISFVAQYYMTPLAISQMPWYPSTKTEYQTVAQTAMSSLNYMFSFEEGEGYDTDGDFKYDGAEIITTFTAETDPLRFDDPARRQALYLSGKDSYAFSPQAQARLINAEDMLKQFTVECWVRPEKEGEAQTIIDRSFLYPGDNLATDKYAIRANFRIGLDAEGKIYGMFDNSHSIESGAEPTKSCQYVTGRKLVLNEWAHVAVTFDGSDLKLYIDGEEVKSASTQLIPANGVVQIIQNPGSSSTFPADMYSYRSGGLFIGARPVKAADVSVKDMPEAAFMINIVDEYGREYPETFSNVREFFGGYVDEVRVWDGARSSEDIKANYRKRFSFAEVKENRDSVLESWRLFAGTRNENDGKATLPPELLFHYNFTTLPGAVEPDYVAKTPAAFEGKVVDVANGNHYAMNDEIDTTGLYSYRNNRSASINDDICVGWWYASDLKNTVYNDYRVVPWIKNTVMHLTPPDGSSLDTFLYTDKFGSAYTQASEHNLGDYTYNNSAQPYSSYALHLDLYQRLLQAELINEQLGDAFDWITQYNEFALRGMFVGSTDLVPLGDAFARTCPKMWDRAVADAWEITGLDDDADGLPNWWEEYQKVNNSYADSPEKSGINWNSTVVRDGVEMTAGDAYKYDIAQGLQPNGEFNDAYRATIDSDGDNLPDWWESYYDIAGSIDTDDDDGDGLSNWAEYVLSEVFDLWTAGGKRAKFDPTDATSVSEFDLDYFFKIGELYAGEIFTDHDFMEDVFEDSWGKAYANRYAWDADSDSDEDGWTTWSEARYCAWAKTPVNPWISHIVGDTEIKDFPVPTLDLIIRYNGTQKLVDGEPLDDENGNESGEAEDEESMHVPLIVRTYTNPDLVKPDAEYLVKPGAEVVHYSPIGLFEKKIVRGTLPHGHINSAAFNLEWAEIHRNDYYTFQVKDLSELDSIWAQKWPAGVHIGTYKEFIELYNLFGDKYIILNSGQVNWNKAPIANYITITQNYTGEDSYICLRGKSIGKINLRTGVYELNLAEFYDEFHGDWTGSDGVLDWGDDEDDDDDDDDDDNTHGKTEIEVESPTSSGMGQMMYRFQFTSIVPELQDNKLEIFLGLSGSGYVRGGKNTIVAFYDLNRDDEYTPGEPMGMVKDVDVGWRNGKVELELTDTNPIISRIDLSTGVSDRNQLWGIDGARDMTNTVGRLMENQFERVRVVRSYTTVTRQLADGSLLTERFNLPVKRVVLDKVMNMSQRPFLFEGDILGKGDLDLDWDYLYDEAINHSDVKGYDLTEIIYEVFFGDVTIPGVNQKLSPEAQANVFSTLIVRSFDSVNNRPKPEAITPGKNGIEVLKANPTFKWKMPNNSNTYTAFKIQIRSGNRVVWESGNGKPLPAPARDGNGVYTFEADAYIGDELENFSSYTWRVSMYNAKFKDDKWSDDLSFSMSVPENVVGYGSIPVAVKYFGPAKVSGASTFVVEAFTTRDFTGIPAARAVVTDPASVTVSDVQHPTNAVLTGLSTGRYFLRAYADLSTDGAVRRKRDSFESWGYACGRGEPGITPFVPTEFVLTDRNGFEKPVDIYIEDVDTNGNSLPDAWEYVENKGKLNVGVEDLDGNVLRAFGISKLLSAQLQDRVIGPYPVNAFNNYIITSLASPGMAALALNYNPNDVIVGENGSIQVESKVESVEIKSVAFNANGNVVVEVDAALNTDDGYSNGFGIIPVEVETRKTVTCQVLWKASLSDTAWTVKAEKTIVVGNGAQTIDIGGLGAEKSGFFKVVVTE